MEVPFGALPSFWGMVMLRIEATRRGAFHPMVDAASACIKRADGWIVAHRFYSDVMAVLTVSCPPEAVATLEAALAEAGFTLHGAASGSPGRGAEVAVQLVLNALHDGPDMRRTVPAFG